MKKFKVELKQEIVEFKELKADAHRFVSYQEYSNGYLCNSGVIEPVKFYEFNSLEEVLKFINENPLPKIIITKDGIRNDVVINKNYNTEMSYEYRIYELDEDEEYNELEEFHFADKFVSDVEEK